VSNELDLRDYFQIIRKRIWWIVCFILVVTILAIGYSKFIKEPIYEASTKIIVNRTTDTNTTQQLNSDVLNTNIRMISTYKEIIKTPAILDKVVENHPEFDINYEQLVRKIKVSSVNDTQVMTVVVSDSSYKFAAQLVNAVSETFKQEIPNLFNVQNVSILNQAKVELLPEPEPVSPNVLLNAIVAFVVSLVIAVAVALLIEYMDDTIKTEEDVERYLGLPTMAMIEKVNSKEKNVSILDSAKINKSGEINHVPVSK